MRFALMLLLNLLIPASAIAAQTDAKLTYVERMGLYADWAIILLFILAVVAFVIFLRRK